MDALLNGTMAALFGPDGIFQWWQGILFLILIGLIVFYWQYKKKQM